MISVDTAIKIVEDTIAPLSVKTIPFENSLGFCLAQDMQSDIDMPPFDRWPSLKTLQPVICLQKQFLADRHPRL